MKSDVVLGGVTSFQSLAIAKTAQRLQHPFIATSPSAPDLTDVGNFVFRSSFADPRQGSALAAFAKEKLTAVRAAIVHDKNSPSAKEVALEFERRFVAGGGKIVTSKLYDQVPANFDTIASELKKADAQVVLAVVSSPVAQSLRESLRKNAPSLAMLGTDQWEQSELTKNSGDTPKIYLASHFAVDDPDSATADFVKKYSAKFGRAPTLNAALAYDGMQMVIETYRRVESARPQVLAKGLTDSKEIKSTSGVVPLDPWRNANKPVIIKEIKGDKEVFATRIQPEM
jgi:branched-chain amino acid transport system substrate-binding protein